VSSYCTEQNSAGRRQKAREKINREDPFDSYRNGIPYLSKSEVLKIFHIGGGEASHSVVAQGQGDACINDLPEPGLCFHGFSGAKKAVWTVGFAFSSCHQCHIGIWMISRKRCGDSLASLQSGRQARLVVTLTPANPDLQPILQAIKLTTIPAK